MKAHLTRVSLALLSAVFILGCQEQGPGPVGPDGLVPQFAKGGPIPLFENPTAFSCEDGATPTGGSFGKVSWAAVFKSDKPDAAHVHFKIELKGVTSGLYTIFGFQFKGGSCVDVDGTEIGTFTVLDGRGSTRTQFTLPDHSPGESKVSVTVSRGGEAPFYGSPSATIKMNKHPGH